MSLAWSNMEWFWPAIATASAVTASAIWYLLKSTLSSKRCDSSTYKLIKQPIDVSQQSHLLPGDERIRASIFAKKDEEFLEFERPDVTTVYENFLLGLKVSNNGDCLGHRVNGEGDYQWLSYQDVLERSHDFGSGLLELGVQTGGKSFIGVYAQNRAEWDIASIGCMAYSLVIVPLYDSLGAEAVAFVVNQANISVVICDGMVKLKKLLENADQMPSLKHVVVMDYTQELTGNGVKTVATDRNIKIHGFQDLSTIGKLNPKPFHLPTPNDLYIVCYTSGTTGNPKGVMITHKNLMCQIACGKLYFKLYNVELSVGEPVISYLPMAHMFEQMVHGLTFTYGAKIGYFQGNVNKLLDDMKALSPGCFPVVPRLLNKLYDKVQSNLSGGGFKKWLFDYAFKCKLDEMRTGVVRKDSIWDKLIFGKIQRELGGNVRMMITGSAPIAQEVLNLSRVMLGALIMEAYGQTEATAAVSMTLPGDMEAGHVGGPLPCAHIKLVDVPELEYFSKDDRGEICIRGPCVSQGYFMEPEKTKEVFDDDGWLHTGDIGMWLPNGTLKVIDRKKHIFKLAQGEYVAPEKIENVYLRCQYVAQIFVDGNSFQRYLVAVVVPDEIVLKKWATEMGLSKLSYDQLCARDDVKAMILKDLQAIGKQNHLNSMEQVKAIHLCADPFSMENGLLTPTMKSKRPILRKRYTSKVDQMYKNIGD